MTRRTTGAADPILDRLAYRCTPDGCPSSVAGRPAACCCIGAAVEVSRGEVRRIESALDGIAVLQPRLRSGGVLADVFTADGDSFVIEAADERGTCPFLFRRRGRQLCAIHSWALQSGVEVARVKPRACRLWPLIVEERKGSRVVTVHPDALQIGCVAPRQELPGQPTLREAFAAEIAELLAG